MHTAALKGATVIWQLQYSTHELDRNCDLGLGVSELGTWLVGEGRTHIDVELRSSHFSLRLPAS